MKQKKIMVNKAKVIVRSIALSEKTELHKWKRCEFCNGLFISARRSARFCSDNHRTQNYIYFNVKMKSIDEALEAIRNRK